MEWFMTGCNKHGRLGNTGRLGLRRIDLAQRWLLFRVNNRRAEAGMNAMKFPHYCAAIALAAMLAACNSPLYLPDGEETPHKPFTSLKNAEIVATCLIDALESNFTAAGVAGTPTETGYRITMKMDGSVGSDIVLVINIKNIPSGSVSSFESKLTWKERRFVNILADCQV
ncbi:MAG: hypothetical protein ACHP7O_01005 [Burkholderiales bacterium]